MRLTLLLILFNISISDNDLQIIRELYLSAYITESKCNNFGEKLASVEDNNSTLIYGYQGCFYFLKSKFVHNPHKKFSYFNKGKKLLEAAIKQDPKSVELRFLRYSIQKNLPKFLLYNNLEKDRDFLNDNIKNINNQDVKRFIIESLKTIEK